MDDIRALADEIRRTRNEAAKHLTIEQRLDAGPQLFRQWMELVRADVLADDPDAGPTAVEAEIRRRLDIARRRDATDRDGKPIYRELPR
jgi:transposase-like protein